MTMKYTKISKTRTSPVIPKSVTASWTKKFHQTTIQGALHQTPSSRWQQPPTRFYGLPKIHKVNMHRVSACGTSTYELAKFLTKNRQQSCSNNNSFAKGSKGLAESLREQKVAPDETLEFFNVNALFTNVLVSVVLEVINRKFTDNINQKRKENFTEHTHFIPKCSPNSESIIPQYSENKPT